MGVHRGAKDYRAQQRELLNEQATNTVARQPADHSVDRAIAKSIRARRNVPFIPQTETE